MLLIGDRVGSELCRHAEHAAIIVIQNIFFSITWGVCDPRNRLILFSVYKDILTQVIVLKYRRTYIDVSLLLYQALKINSFIFLYFSVDLSELYLA